MAAISCTATVDRMKESHNNTVDWDVVVSYKEDQINRLLEQAFNKEVEKEKSDADKKKSEGKQPDPPKAISEIECKIEETNQDEDTYYIHYQFKLKAPKIKFVTTNAGPLCTLTIPVCGGKAWTDSKSHDIKDGSYELVFSGLDLAAADGEENDPEKYKGADLTFEFPVDDTKVVKACVVINIPASDPSVAINTLATKDDDKVKFIDNHKGDVADGLKLALKTVHKAVRLELAHLRSDKPPEGWDDNYIQLRPRSFKFSAYSPETSASDKALADKNSILSLFIRTGDADNGEKKRLFSKWDSLWKDQNKCAPIPDGYSASIILNKRTLFNTAIQPTLTHQGYTGDLENTDKNITLSIDTKKSVHRDAEDRLEKLGDGSTNEYKVSAVDKTMPKLQVTLDDDSSYHARCVGNWKLDYHFDWSFYHDDRYAGVGGRSYGSNGGVTATHTLDKQLALCAVVDQWKLSIDCPISSSDWVVSLSGDDKNWWEQFCGGTKEIPDWVKNMSVEVPSFTLHLGNLYFFLTTNLLLPSQRVIKVDTGVGIQIPGDLYLVGDVLSLS